MIPILFFGMTGLFLLLRAGPMDPVSAIFGQKQSPDDVQRLREALKLNRPLWEQYLDFMVELLTFDFGQSWVLKPDRPAKDLIISRLPRTMWLGFWSALIALVIGIPLGFYAGLNPNTFGDYFASFGGIVWRAMPNFWLAIILIAMLSNSESLFGFSWRGFLVQTDKIITAPPLDLLSVNGFLVAFKMILPGALVLGSASMGNEMRIGRTAVLETVNSNYVEMAKAKGVPPRKIVWKHIFRNALIPLVPIITAELGFLLGGSVIVEQIFAINGIGQLYFQAMVQADLPLAATLAYIFILFGLSINILQDFLYTVIDPRVGFEGK